MPRIKVDALNWLFILIEHLCLSHMRLGDSAAKNGSLKKHVFKVD